MTDDPRNDDAQVAGLLQALEDDQSKRSHRRAEILTNVLDQYDRERRTSNSESNFELVAAEPTQLRQKRGTARIWLAAAAALLIIAVSAPILRGDEPTRLDATAEGDAPPTDASEENTTADSIDESGVDPARVTLFAGRVSFESVTGLSITAEDADVVVLGNNETANDVSSGIVVLSRGSSRFADRIAAFESNGPVLFSQRETRVNGRVVEGWTVSITQSGVDQFACAINEPCFEAIQGNSATAITSGTILSITEVIAPNGDAFLVLADDQGALRPDLSAMLSTLEVS